MATTISQNASLLQEYGTIVCVDVSYVAYHALYSAVKKWTDESPMASVLDDVDTEDPNFTQVDITAYPDFVEVLKEKAITSFSKISTMVDDFNKTNCSSTLGNMICVMDPPKGSKLKSWRYVIYPEYKGNRAASRDKKPFDVRKAFCKFTDLIMEESFKSRFGLDFVYADGCEADDLVALYLMDESNASAKKFLVASDKDYLQLEGVTQMTLEGKQVEIEQPYPDLITLTPETYLLAKIITGDTSDNIPHIFNGVAYKKAVKKYVANMQFLTESLENDAIALKNFKLNTRLIDFKRIPKSVRQIGRRVLGLE